MLIDQVFYPPVTIAVGHELFFTEENVLNIDFENVADLKQALIQGSYSLQVVDVCESPLVGLTKPYMTRIQSLGIPLVNFICVNADKPAMMVQLNHFLRLVDVAYSPMLLSKPGILYKDVQARSKTAKGFIRTLRQMAVEPQPFNREKFQQRATLDNV